MATVEINGQLYRDLPMPEGERYVRVVWDVTSSDGTISNVRIEPAHKEPAVPTHEADRILDNIDNEIAGLSPSRRLRVLTSLQSKVRDLIDEANDEIDEPEDDEDDDDDDIPRPDLHY